MKAEFTLEGARRPRPTMQVSAGGDRWRTVIPAVSRNGDGTWSAQVSGSGRDHRRPAAWLAGDRHPWTRVSLTDRATVPTTAPGSFALTAPTPGSDGVSTQASITWQPAADAAYYDLVVSEHADLSDPVLSVSGLTTTAYQPAQPWPGERHPARAGPRGQRGRVDLGQRGARHVHHPGCHPWAPVYDFDTYATDADLQAAWTRNSGGDPITPTLGDPGEGSGPRQHGADVRYRGERLPGVIRPLPSPQDWRETNGLRLWVRPAREDQELGLQFTARGSFWEHKLRLTGTEGRVVVVPWTQFSAPPPWAPRVSRWTCQSVTNVALDPTAQMPQDTLTIDAISATP